MTEDHYPIKVPEWDGKGYIRDKADGCALMHLRRSPWVSVKPGQGIAVVKCRCLPNKSTKGSKKCQNCVCAKVGLGLCSPMCKCAFVCGKGGPKRVHAEGENGASGAQSDAGGVDRRPEEEGDEELRPAVPGQSPMIDNVDNGTEQGGGDDAVSHDDDFDLPGMDTGENTLTACGRPLDDVELYYFCEEQGD